MLAMAVVGVEDVALNGEVVAEECTNERAAEPGGAVGTRAERVGDAEGCKDRRRPKDGEGIRMERAGGC